MKWNFQKSLHNRESRDIFFCNPCSNAIPFGFSGKDIYFFWNPYREVKTKGHWEDHYSFFKPERVCTWKFFNARANRDFFSFFFFFLFHGIGVHILSKSRPSSCVLFQPWYKHKGMMKEWSMIFARVCICAGSISVHWIKTIRNIWANDWYFYVAFETVYGREAEKRERKREKEGGGGGGEGGEGTKVSHFSWHPRVFVLSIEPLCSTLRYPKSHVSMH